MHGYRRQYAGVPVVSDGLGVVASLCPCMLKQVKSSFEKNSAVLRCSSGTMTSVSS